MTKKSNATKITNIAVSKLVLSPLNPRQTVDQGDVEALAQSIKACGLIQNLVGIEEGDKIGIVAGGRRLRALQHLLENKEVLASFPVSVRMADNEEQALEWANAENAARKDLNPSDEIRAYRTMQEKGFGADKIAIAFAQTVRHVKGRLRLANLAESILEALAQGEITLDVAAAYTICDEQEKQAEVFEQMKNHWHGDDPHVIKRCFMRDANTINDPRVKFVGREAYEEAGGAIREDLFGEEVYFLDPELLEKLLVEKLETSRTKWLEMGWKWVEVCAGRPDYYELNQMECLAPSPMPLSDQNQARMEALQDLYDEGNATDLEIDELEALQELTAPQYLPVDMDFAGAYLWIDSDGDIRAEEGYIKPEDIEGAVRAGLIADTAKVKSGKKQSETEAAGFEYSRALLEDMSIIRTGAMQAAILEDEELAKDIAIFSLITKAWDSALPCSIETSPYKNEVEEHGQTLPEELTVTESWNRPSADVVAKRFAAFRTWTPKEKADALTLAVARSVAAHVTSDKTSVPFTELLADTVKLDPRKTWTPNSTFLKRLKGAQLDEIESYIHGFPVSPNFAGMKKGDKVSHLHALFNNEADRDGLSEGAKERIANWTPDCLKNRYQAPEKETSQQQEDENSLAAA